jgi:hypothetical protein
MSEVAVLAGAVSALYRAGIPNYVAATEGGATCQYEFTFED